MQATIAANWPEWLVLADAYSMQRLTCKAAERLLKEHTSSAASWKAAAPRLSQLGPRALAMLLDATLVAAYNLLQGGPFRHQVPDLSSWRKLGDA